MINSLTEWKEIAARFNLISSIQLCFTHMYLLYHLRSELHFSRSDSAINTQVIIVIPPMAESFVAVCDILLKFHNLSAKFVCSFNEQIMH